MSQSSQFSLLKASRFGPFFSTMAMGALNDNIFKNALAAMLVFESSRMAGMDDKLLVPLSGLVFILPFFLFSALFGQFADKFEKSRQIRWVKVLEFGIMLVATLGFWTGNLWMLFTVLFLLGLQSTIFGPIKFGILPQVLKEQELVGGNALVEMGTFVAILVGTIAGPLLIRIDAPWPLWVSLVCLAVALFGWLTSLKIPRAPAPDPGLNINWNIFTETIRNIRFINTNRTVLNSVLGISWFWFFGSVFLLQIFGYTKHDLGGDERLVSLLLALFIIGISTGSLLCERLSGKQVEIGLVPFGAFGLTLFGIDLYFASPTAATEMITVGQFFSHPPNWRIVADLLMIGLFGGFYTVPLYALVQARAAPGRKARVIAGLNIVNALLMVIAAVYMMILLGPAGLTIPELFLATAILNAVVAIYIFTLVPEFLMRFLVWILIHSIYRVKTEGLEKIPVQGALIVAANHVSFVDPLIIGGLVRRPVRFVMYHKIFKIPLLNFIFRTGKAIPIAPRSEDPEILEAAYKKMRQVLKNEAVLGIFPEGGITYDGEIQTFKKGIQKIIAEQPVPVVPMALCNLWGSLFSRKDKLHKRRPRKFWQLIELRVGDPIPPEEVTAERLEAEVRKLRGDDL